MPTLADHIFKFPISASPAVCSECGAPATWILLQPFSDGIPFHYTRHVCDEHALPYVEYHDVPARETVVAAYAGATPP